MRDTDERCPECDALAWVMIDVGPHTRLVGCERCAFVVGGMAIGEPLRDTPTERPKFRGSRGRKPGPGDLERVTSMGFPVYGLVGTPPDVTRLRGEEDAYVSIELAHPDHTLRVVSWTEADEPREPLSFDLQRLLSEREPTGYVASHAASLIEHAVARRNAARRPTHASTTTIAVDGMPQPFELLSAGDAWAARRSHDGVEITVLARAVDPAGVQLTRLV